MRGTVKQLIPLMIELDNDKIYELKEYKEKRSLNANAYYWVLVNKIADVLGNSKEAVHMTMLKRYSQVTVVCLPAEENIKGFVKYYELDGAFKNKGKMFKTYKVYKPSSEMNKNEMSKLIDGIVSECEQMNIQTLTPNQLLELKSLWGE